LLGKIIYDPKKYHNGRSDGNDPLTNPSLNPKAPFFLKIWVDLSPKCDFKFISV